MKTALVLSGGGALGLAHVGVLKSLEERGCSFDYFAGTSAGAIIASCIACGLSSDHIFTNLCDKSLFRLAFDFSFRGGGILRGSKVLTLLRDVYEDRSFSDLPNGVKLRVYATNFETGEQVVLNSGSIAEAVRASLSVPGIFEPYWLNGVPLVDGGLVSNLPLREVLDEYEGEKIIAVDVCTSISSKLKTNLSIRKSIERSMKIMFKAQQSVLKNDPRLTLIRPELENYSSTDILNFKEMFQIGYESGQVMLSV